MILGAVLLCLAGAAQAETQTFSFSGSGFPKSGGFTITGFDGTLGTLDKAVLTTSGTVTVTVRPTGPYAPTVQYNFQSSEGIYQADGPATYGGTGLKGSGTVSYTNPNGPNPDFSYVFPLSGSSDTTYTTAVQLAQFTNKTINGYFLFDQPGGFLTNNGTVVSYDFSNVSATANGSGSITYFYTPLRSALPEPTSWALMMLGTGAVGGALRRRWTTTRKAFA